MVEKRERPGYVAAGEGTPVVMIPGMEGAKEFWHHQLEGLCPSYRVISCDLAVRRPSAASCVGDYAEDILRKMDDAGVGSAVVVGESMGGMVAQEIALNHPGRVKGLVLCNTMDDRRRFGFGFNMFTLATFVHQFAFLPFLTYGQRKRLLNWVGKHRGFVMDPSPGNDGFCDYIMEYGTAAGPLGYLDRLIACGGAGYTGRLHEIDVPTLVLRGTEDRLVTPEAAVQLAGRIPGSEVALVEGGGHCCPYTCPDRTNRVLLEWLKRKCI